MEPNSSELLLFFEAHLFRTFSEILDTKYTFALTRVIDRAYQLNYYPIPFVLVNKFCDSKL